MFKFSYFYSLQELDGAAGGLGNTKETTELEIYIHIRPVPH